jgi:hypothetical protein
VIAHSGSKNVVYSPTSWLANLAVKALVVVIDVVYFQVVRIAQRVRESGLA